MIDEVVKGEDRAHGGSTTSVRGKTPLTWPLLREGRRAMCEVEEEGAVLRAGPTVLYLVLCRASELFAYDDTELY